MFGEWYSMWGHMRVAWEGPFGNACRAITNALTKSPHCHGRDKLRMESAIKWKLVLPALLLKKPPSLTGTKAVTLQCIVQQHLNQYKSGDWRGLIVNYEADVVLAGTMRRWEDLCLDKAKIEARIWRAADLLTRFHCGKARKYRQSNMLGGHTNPDIVAQMKAKTPVRKRAITPLTEEALSYTWKSLNWDWFIAKLTGLRHDVAPGLGYLRNEHPMALVLNPGLETTLCAKAAVDNYSKYACLVVLVELSTHFYAA